jgi:hypothetical protein
MVCSATLAENGLGPDRIDGAVTGLNFPFAAPARLGREGRSRLSS